MTTPDQPKQPALPWEDEVLRRMLNTPPPHKARAVPATKKPASPKKVE